MVGFFQPDLREDKESTLQTDRNTVLAKPRPCEHKSLIKASEKASVEAEGGQPQGGPKQKTGADRLGQGARDGEVKAR